MAEATRPAVSVIVPVYRNRDTVEELHRRLTAVLERAATAHEVLFVNDGCPDGSAAVLQELARVDDRVGVLDLQRNVGQHLAVLAGLREARGERVVVIDADLQDAPEVIPILVDRLDGGPAAVFAGRRGRYASLGRMLTSRAFKGLLAAVSGVPRDAGLFVAMDRRMVAALLRYREPRPFLVALMGLTRLPLVSIPVRRSARPAGTSAYRTRDRVIAGGRALLLALRIRLGFRRRGPAPEIQVARRIGSRFTTKERPVERHPTGAAG